MQNKIKLKLNSTFKFIHQKLINLKDFFLYNLIDGLFNFFL